MIGLLLVIGSALGVELPDRPVQGPVQQWECEEGAIVGGVPDPPLPEQCEAVILPLSVWGHLEALAIDSATVRDLYALREAEHKYELALLNEQIRYLNRPLPWHERPGVRVSLSAAGVIAAIVAYEAATRPIR